MKRVIFENNPLVEVILQFRFPTILSINANEPVDKFGCKKQAGNLVDSLNSGEELDMRKAVRSALHASMKKTEYF